MERTVRDTENNNNKSMKWYIHELPRVAGANYLRLSGLLCLLFSSLLWTLGLELVLSLTRMLSSQDP